MNRSAAVEIPKKVNGNTKWIFQGNMQTLLLQRQDSCPSPHLPQCQPPIGADKSSHLLPLDDTKSSSPPIGPALQSGLED